MNCATESTHPLVAVEVKPLPSGQTDVWLRKDIQGPTERVGEDGVASQVYTANEAYMRINRAMTQSAAEADFDALWTEAAAYRPDAAQEDTSEQDVNAMLVDHEYRLTLMELGV